MTQIILGNKVGGGGNSFVEEFGWKEKGLVPCSGFETNCLLGFKRNLHGKSTIFWALNNHRPIWWDLSTYHDSDAYSNP